MLLKPVNLTLPLFNSTPVVSCFVISPVSLFTVGLYIFAGRNKFTYTSISEVPKSLDIVFVILSAIFNKSELVNEGFNLNSSLKKFVSKSKTSLLFLLLLIASAIKATLTLSTILGSVLPFKLGLSMLGLFAIKGNPWNTWEPSSLICTGATKILIEPWPFCISMSFKVSKLSICTFLPALVISYSPLEFFFITAKVDWGLDSEIGTGLSTFLILSTLP